MLDCKDAEYQHNNCYQQLHKSISIIPQNPKPSVQFALQVAFGQLNLFVWAVLLQSCFSAQFVCSKPPSLFHKPAAVLLYVTSQVWLSVWDW